MQSQLLSQVLATGERILTADLPDANDLRKIVGGLVVHLEAALPDLAEAAVGDILGEPSDQAAAEPAAPAAPEATVPGAPSAPAPGAPIGTPAAPAAEQLPTPVAAPAESETDRLTRENQELKAELEQQRAANATAAGSQAPAIVTDAPAADAPADTFAAADAAPAAPEQREPATVLAPEPDAAKGTP